MPNEIRVVFTADLKPFADGLRSMLFMTAATGKQITPLLNMQAKVDTSVIDQQLKAIAQSTDEYIKQMAEAAKITGTLGSKSDETGKKIDNAEKAVSRKGVSLNKLKRNALETFGAISFLAQGMFQLASEASGGDKQLQKMSQSMSQGISAGFGLAGMMSMLGLATAGTAVAIGAVVAIGVAMLSFFDQGEKKAEMLQRRMLDFSNSLKGASLKDLQTYREAIRLTIVSLDKDIADSEQNRIAFLKSGMMLAAAASQEAINRDKQRREVHVQEMRKIEEQATAHQMTEAELRNKIRELEAQGVQDKFERMHVEENLRYEKELESIRNSNATKETIRAAVRAAELAHQTRLTEIFKQEEAEREKVRKDHEEKRKQDEEAERQRSQRIRDLELETFKASLAADRARELAQTDSAKDRVAIEEFYALNAINAEEAVALATAKTEEDRTLTLAKFSALREQLRAESGLKFIDAERQDAEKWKDTWLKNNSIILDTISAGFDELWRDIMIGVARTSQTEIEQRELSQEVFLLDLEQRKSALMDQLREGEISEREYHLRIRELELERRQREEEDLAFKQSLDEERKSSFERAWGAMQEIALAALGEILREEIKGAIISMATTKSAEASKTATVATGTAARQTSLIGETLTTMASAAASILKAVASAIEWQVATFGPFAIFTIGASLAGIYGLWEGAKKTLGFAQGGKRRPGEVGFIEGVTTELIAPEKDFYDIARAEIIPKMLLMTAETVDKNFRSSARESIGSGFGSDRFDRLLERLEKMEFEIRGNNLVTVTNNENEATARAGIR